MSKPNWQKRRSKAKGLSHCGNLDAGETGRVDTGGTLVVAVSKNLPGPRFMIFVHANSAELMVCQNVLFIVDRNGTAGAAAQQGAVPGC
jgi:hypothetical protein